MLTCAQCGGDPKKFVPWRLALRLLLSATRNVHKSTRVLQAVPKTVVPYDLVTSFRKTWDADLGLMEDASKRDRLRLLRPRDQQVKAV